MFGAGWTRRLGHPGGGENPVVCCLAIPLAHVTCQGQSVRTNKTTQHGPIHEYADTSACARVCVCARISGAYSPQINASRMHFDLLLLLCPYRLHISHPPYTTLFPAVFS
jgi:hypothetical protein